MQGKKYNFDEIINRKGSGALKIDALKERYGRDDLIGMWVADMDFRCGDFITDALKRRCDHGIFGYSITPEGFRNSIIRWTKSRHQWELQKEWISYIPGIVKGIALCIMHFTKPNEKVIIQTPVYHPFRIVTKMHGRTVVNNPLIEEKGLYRMDLEGLKSLIDNDKDVKLLILCNPHNPVGITWDAATLRELTHICSDRGVLVISDEIHADMALFGHHHLPFATVSHEAEHNSITFMAPSKTFNIAGIVSSYAIIPNPDLRSSFYRFLAASELDEGTIFAYTATEAAYIHGEAWLLQMLTYLEDNIRFVDTYLKEYIPEIHAVIPQASFLVWLDCRRLQLSQRDLVALFVDGAGLALNDGEIFGMEGRGFMRLNVGCPRAVLQKALEQLNNAVTSLDSLETPKKVSCNAGKDFRNLD
ncbi:MAG: PatB family C-S lyase [Dysgonamonadaceae bacterium]|jgi:cystathionine beta-lyase|nr:PatB family C-S lyase [Dysgonamonadaceae bacterium]